MLYLQNGEILKYSTYFRCLAYRVMIHSLEIFHIMQVLYLWYGDILEVFHKRQVLYTQDLKILKVFHNADLGMGET